MYTVPQGSTTVEVLSESVGGQLSESVGVCRSCRRTIVGALSDCRNRAQQQRWAQPGHSFWERILCEWQIHLHIDRLGPHHTAV